MTSSFPRLLLVSAVALAACAPDALPPLAAAPDLAESRDGSGRTPSTISLSKIGSFDGGGTAAAEITAFDHVSDRLFVVNGALGTVDVLDLAVPSSPVRIAQLQLSGPANSVATYRGLVAIAVEGAEKTAPGTVEFYRAGTLEPLGSVPVGSLPDMVTFSPNGKYVVVANEGEPNADYSVDPEGSVSIIDVRAFRGDADRGDDRDRKGGGDEYRDAEDDKELRGLGGRPGQGRPVVRTASFTRFNGSEDALRAKGIRIYGPNASAAQDFEPEYVTVDEDERTAWVTLQENNAVAIIDLPSATVREIVPLGYKDHRLAGNALDASDRDNAINIRNWPVFGMYQPDAIASFRIGRQTYLITANEGDAREYTTFAEEARVSALALDPAVFTDEICGGPCRDNARLGRLTVTRTLGQGANGLYGALYALGGRSFSILRADGSQLWDSGDDLEQRTTALPNVAFNASNTGNTADDRSDNKGPEPEGVAIGKIGEKTFAFIGLERVGGVMVYDVSVPSAPQFVTYVNTRDGATGDRGPEGIVFVEAKRSPNRKPLVIVGNEISGTTAIFEVVLR